MPDGIEGLVFPNTALTNIAVYGLMRYQALDGKTFIPPDENLQHIGSNLIFMTVPANIFLRDVLSPGGKARDCLYPRGTP